MQPIHRREDTSAIFLQKFIVQFPVPWPQLRGGQGTGPVEVHVRNTNSELL